MTTKITQEQIGRVLAFHGHLCPGVTTGMRVAEIALREIGAHAQDEEIVAVVETDNCAIDAIQVLVGTTFGKGNLIHLDHGQNVFTFARRSDGKALRISRRPQPSRGLTPEEEMLADKVNQGTATDTERQAYDAWWRQRSLAVLDQDEDEMFEITSLVDYQIPDPATIYPSVACEGCGQMTMSARITQVAGRSLCPKCAAAQGLSRPITMHPIGIVSSPLLADQAPPRAKAKARVIVEPAYHKALAGIQPGQTIEIVFAFDRASGETPLLQHPRGDASRPKRGVFSLRSPQRPNPIGITSVKVLAVKENVLVVEDLDAWDGTPVLDIKPSW